LSDLVLQQQQQKQQKSEQTRHLMPLMHQKKPVIMRSSAMEIWGVYSPLQQQEVWGAWVDSGMANTT
jgi:hypothetical protein